MERALAGFYGAMAKLAAAPTPPLGLLTKCSTTS